MSQEKINSTQRALVEKVRQACIQAAIAGFEQARMDGLCEEGAVETAVSAIQNLNLDQLLGDSHFHPE
ncbi:MAG: acetyltransferase [Anaerolineaceae bacterium]|nr:acetyltransferase [Anaerolineaceae bacterium]